MFKRSIFSTAFTLSFLFAGRLFSLVIIDAKVCGYSNIEIKVVSPPGGSFIIERKEKNKAYVVIGKTDKVFKDVTTKKNTVYTYRARLRDDVSNNVKVNTAAFKVLLKSHKKKPVWVNKTEFDTKNYHFKVLRFSSDYSNEAKLKKSFLLSLLSKKADKEISNTSLRQKLLAFLASSITAASLKSARPYREKILEYEKNSSRIYTKTSILYGISKKDVLDIINASRCILNQERQHEKNYLQTPCIKRETGLYMHLKLMYSKKLLERNIAAMLNRFRAQKGLSSLKYIAGARTDYVFSSGRCASTYTWKGNIYSIYAFFAVKAGLEKNIAASIKSKPQALLSDYISKVSIKIELKTEKGIADLKVVLNFS